MGTVPCKLEGLKIEEHVRLFKQGKSRDERGPRPSAFNFNKAANATTATAAIPAATPAASPSMTPEEEAELLNNDD